MDPQHDKIQDDNGAQFPLSEFQLGVARFQHHGRVIRRYKLIPAPDSRLVSAMITNISLILALSSEVVPYERNNVS
jgi:hypothetical protein